MHKQKPCTAATKVLTGKKLVKSDLKFVWRIHRYHSQNWRAIEKDMVKCGFANSISVLSSTLDNEKNEKKIRSIFAKHTKRWYTYTLYRHCIQRDDVLNAIYKTKKESGMSWCVFKETDNYKLLESMMSLEESKTRHFSSLAAMQRYADKHKLGIDIYSLWKTEKNNIKETKNYGN